MDGKQDAYLELLSIAKSTLPQSSEAMQAALAAGDAESLCVEAHGLKGALRHIGAGALSLMAARRCARVAGIELSGQAVRDARRNAEANDVRNASFHQGFAEEAFPRMVAEGFSPDAVLLDPPRRGAHPALLRGIADARPKTVVYVSCHPPSQARDAAALCGMGYRVAAARPFDMFCQTAEVENVLTFKSTQEAGHA